MNQILEFSNQSLYTIIVLATALFFVFRLIVWLLPALLLRKDKRRHAWRYTSIFELIVWIIFLSWSVTFLSGHSPMYAIGLFILLFLFTFFTAWIVLRDFVAGAFFKTVSHFKINETIKIGDYSGKILRFTPSAIILETEAGESIYLPYSYLAGKVVIKSNPAETILSHTFRIEIPPSQNLSATIQAMNTDILLMPWSSLKQEPQIKVAAQTPTGHILELTVFSIQKEYFLHIQKLIKEKYALPAAGSA